MQSKPLTACWQSLLVKKGLGPEPDRRGHSQCGSSVWILASIHGLCLHSSSLFQSLLAVFFREMVEKLWEESQWKKKPCPTQTPFHLVQAKDKQVGHICGVTRPFPGIMRSYQLWDFGQHLDTASSYNESPPIPVPVSQAKAPGFC